MWCVGKGDFWLLSFVVVIVVFVRLGMSIIQEGNGKGYSGQSVV